MNTKRSSQAEFRRHQDNLVTIGTGVMAIGVVTMLQLLLFIFTNASELKALMPELDNDELFAITMVVLCAVGLIDLLVRAYVGLSARAEGSGKKKGMLYVIVAIVIALADALLFVYSMLQLPVLGDSPFDVVITFAFLLVSIVTIIQMIISAFYVKRHSEQVD